MNRRKAREHALRQLFRAEFAMEGENNAVPEELSGTAKDVGQGEKGFADELVRGTLGHAEEIDAIIQKAAENWEIGRMAVVDRNILRCAVYELVYRNDIPPAVTINEALEIAKKYSSLDSVSFINGLLDKIAHTVGERP
ncbi:MAG: transcription antitermination factor NusB [Nitrospirae bacterium]|nr:transcription antitermination factor NusB [Nitrospirota bacterium]